MVISYIYHCKNANGARFWRYHAFWTSLMQRCAKTALFKLHYFINARFQPLRPLLQSLLFFASDSIFSFWLQLDRSYLPFHNTLHSPSKTTAKSISTKLPLKITNKIHQFHFIQMGTTELVFTPNLSTSSIIVILDNETNISFFDLPFGCIHLFWNLYPASFWLYLLDFSFMLCTKPKKGLQDWNKPGGLM